METEPIQCATAGCGYSPFPMTTAFVARARRTGETFFCPAGHSLHFGEGSDGRERRKLRERLEDLEGRLRQVLFEKTVLSRTCPWVGCPFIAASGDEWNRAPLHTHMRAIHGMPTLAEVKAMQSEAS